MYIYVLLSVTHLIINNSFFIFNIYYIFHFFLIFIFLYVFHVLIHTIENRIQKHFALIFISIIIIVKYRRKNEKISKLKIINLFQNNKNTEGGELYRE